MKLKRNTEIKISAWYNDQSIVNENWQVFSEDGDGQFFIFVKDQTGENQLKIRIDRVKEIVPEMEAEKV